MGLIIRLRAMSGFPVRFQSNTVTPGRLSSTAPREMPLHKKKTDKRLLGTWRSDRVRTLKEWVWKPGTTPKRRKRISDIFGHLTIRYARHTMHSDFKGEKDSQPYEVIGSDSGSVAIMYYVGWMEERRISHIHFDGKRHYWIAIGRHREWFKKITKPAG